MNKFAQKQMISVQKVKRPGKKKARQQQGLNLRGTSPSDFKSDTLTTRSY